MTHFNTALFALSVVGFSALLAMIWGSMKFLTNWGNKHDRDCE